MSSALRTLVTIVVCFAFSEINGLQRFAEQPVYTEVNPNEDAILSCKVIDKQGSCSWQKDNKPVGIYPKKYEWAASSMMIHQSLQPPHYGGDCSLWIRSATLDFDDGFWECQVTASDFTTQDALTSQPVRLVVRVTPQRPRLEHEGVHVPPGHNVTVDSGGVATVKCISHYGNPPATLKWFLGGREIPALGAQVNATEADNPRTWSATSVVQVKASRERHGEMLQCIAFHESYATKSMSVEARMDIKYAPTIRLLGAPQIDLEEGKDVLILRCEADANPPASIVWRRSGRSEIASLQESLQLRPVSRGDAGLYTCQAQNTVGTSEQLSVEVDVKYPPRINIAGPDLLTTAPLYSPAAFICDADGNPPPTFKWFQRLPTGSKLLERGMEKRLVIDNVTYDYQGEYECHATNYINGQERTVTSSPVSLQVVGAPQVLRLHPGAHSVSVRKGQTASLSLVVCADPRPRHVAWEWGSLRLEAGAGITRYHADEVLQDSREDCYLSTLHIRDVDMHDARPYYLVVENERGVDRHAVHLIVEGTFTEPLEMSYLLGIAGGCIAALLILICLCIYAVRAKKCCFKGRSGYKSSDKDSEKADLKSRSDSTSGPQGDSIYTTPAGFHHNHHHGGVIQGSPEAMKSNNISKDKDSNDDCKSLIVNDSSSSSCPDNNEVSILGGKLSSDSSHVSNSSNRNSYNCSYSYNYSYRNGDDDNIGENNLNLFKRCQFTKLHIFRRKQSFSSLQLSSDLNVDSPSLKKHAFRKYKSDDVIYRQASCDADDEVLQVVGLPERDDKLERKPKNVEKVTKNSSDTPTTPEMSVDLNDPNTFKHNIVNEKEEHLIIANPFSIFHENSTVIDVNIAPVVDQSPKSKLKSKTHDKIKSLSRKESKTYRPDFTLAKNNFDTISENNANLAPNDAHHLYGMPVSYFERQDFLKTDEPAEQTSSTRGSLRSTSKQQNNHKKDNNTFGKVPHIKKLKISYPNRTYHPGSDSKRVAGDGDSAGGGSGNTQTATSLGYFERLQQKTKQGLQKIREKYRPSSSRSVHNYENQSFERSPKNEKRSADQLTDNGKVIYKSYKSEIDLTKNLHYLDAYLKENFDDLKSYSRSSNSVGRIPRRRAGTTTSSVSLHHRKKDGQYLQPLGVYPADSQELKAATKSKSRQSSNYHKRSKSCTKSLNCTAPLLERYKADFSSIASKSMTTSSSISSSDYASVFSGPTNPNLSESKAPISQATQEDGKYSGFISNNFTYQSCPKSDGATYSALFNNFSSNDPYTSNLAEGMTSEDEDATVNDEYNEQNFKPFYDVDTTIRREQSLNPFVDDTEWVVPENEDRLSGFDGYDKNVEYENYLEHYHNHKKSKIHEYSDNVPQYYTKKRSPSHYNHRRITKDNHHHHQTDYDEFFFHNIRNSKNDENIQIALNSSSNKPTRQHYEALGKMFMPPPPHPLSSSHISLQPPDNILLSDESILIPTMQPQPITSPSPSPSPPPPPPPPASRVLKHYNRHHHRSENVRENLQKFYQPPHYHHSAVHYNNKMASTSSSTTKGSVSSDGGIGTSDDNEAVASIEITAASTPATGPSTNSNKSKRAYQHQQQHHQNSSRRNHSHHNNHQRIATNYHQHQHQQQQQEKLLSPAEQFKEKVTYQQQKQQQQSHHYQITSPYPSQPQSLSSHSAGITNLCQDDKETFIVEYEC
ncbi:unnamed protein product [Hermetia illucens]|uniref:Ig-like domain-containing protein n=1 Tax=Hermetia illucens TaxID=343691 RepID=A0A7R8V3M6_HERIL|nr:unnamed protein product [Hermetia illucens]